MADSIATSNGFARYRPWLLLGLLVLAHAIFNVLLEPFQGNRPSHVMVMGVTFLQPVLFASWLTLGPSPATKRWPLTIAAFVAIMFAGGMGNDELLSPDYLIMAGAFFAITIVVMLIVAKLSGWRISNANAAGRGDMPQNQFSLKYLLGITTICAVLLGIGRALTLTRSWNNPPLWSNVLAQLITPIGLIMLAMLPAIIAPMMILSRKPHRGVVVALPFLWVGLSWLAVETIVAVANPPRWEIVRDVVMLQAGGVSAGVASAAVLRFAGYRLLKRTATAPTPGGA